MPPLRCSEHCRDRHVGRRVERERERAGSRESERERKCAEETNLRSFLSGGEGSREAAGSRRE